VVFHRSDLPLTLAPVLVRITEPPDESPKQGLSPSRTSALEQLQRRADESISLGSLADLFRLTCCACGMEDLPTYCSGCPMLDLVNRVLAGSTRTTSDARLSGQRGA
jgi:hypothetical protein